MIIRIGRGTDQGEHLLHFHKTGGRRMRIELGSVWIEQRDAVYPVAITKGVVVVFAEKQVGGAALIRRNHRSRHDSRRIVPAESARYFLGREVAAEAQEKPAKTATRVTQDAKVNIVIGRHRD